MTSEGTFGNRGLAVVMMTVVVGAIVAVAVPVVVVIIITAAIRIQVGMIHAGDVAAATVDFFDSSTDGRAGGHAGEILAAGREKDERKEEEKSLFHRRVCMQKVRLYRKGEVILCGHPLA